MSSSPTAQIEHGIARGTFSVTLSTSARGLPHGIHVAGIVFVSSAAIRSIVLISSILPPTRDVRLDPIHLKVQL
jgi:hypothetical protein